VYFLFVIVWLSVLMQSIVWKDSSEKYLPYYVSNGTLNPTHTVHTHPMSQYLDSSVWRMGVRRVWGLPYDCRTSIIQILSDTLAMYDVIYKRSLMFIKRCLSGESDLVRFIVQYGVLYGGVASCIGRNILTYNKQYISVTG